MKILSKKFDAIDEVIIEAATGNLSWTEALLIVSKSVGADAMTMYMIAGAGGSCRSLGAFGFDQQMIEEYISYYHDINPRFAARSGISESTILFDYELPIDMLGTSGKEFWRWLEDNHAPSQAATLVSPLANCNSILIGVHRYKLNDTNADLTNFLVGFDAKLKMADKIRRNSLLCFPRQSIEIEKSILSHTIDIEFGYDSAIFNPSPTVMVRLKALDLLNAGLLPQLQFNKREANIELAQSLKMARQGHVAKLSLDTPVANCSISIIMLDTADDERRFAMTINFVMREGSNHNLIANALNLTKRQSEIVSLIAEGWTIADAAKQMGISTNTGRVFLAQVFDRTGIRRRIELIRVVDSLLWQ